MRARAARAQDDSDVAYFHDLMYYGELVLKLVTCAVLAGLTEDRDRNRYRLEHKLARANSPGDWAAVLSDALSGPASQSLVRSARDEQRELTKQWGVADGSWQSQAVSTLHAVCVGLDPSRGTLPAKIPLSRWFSDFAWLRNRMRAHGAPTAAKCTAVCPSLRDSIDNITDGFSAFQRSWAYLHRNLSGKYRVSSLAGDSNAFQRYKTEHWHALPDGVYIVYDEPSKVPLVDTDVDITDFWIANGGFNGQRYELLSYITDDCRLVDAGPYMAPVQPLPASETHGHEGLDLQGKSFGNIPTSLPDYVTRPRLESELSALLHDDRHPVVTLAGRGGIGKTSLAIEVLHQTAAAGHYFCIVWFSARDIDLSETGPKRVRPDVLTIDDIANVFATMSARAAERNRKGFDPVRYLSQALANPDGPDATLFVFDNFETVRYPAELYSWLDTYIRLPNKILITTRLRDFKGDYPIEVGGMSEPEFQELVSRTGTHLGITELLTPAYLEQLYEECDGHPYVAKILLGEVARAGRPVAAKRVMAGKDDVLDALFERTYAQLPPAAQRVLLTLCNWRSTVPQIALEAALMRPGNESLDVGAALETLRLCSFTEVLRSPTGDDFVQVPLAAALFGKRKLTTSHMKAAVEADTAVLHEFGAGVSTDVAQGLEPRVRRLFRHVVRRLQSGDPSLLEEFEPILQFIANRYPPAWIQLAKLYEEYPGGKAGQERAMAAIQRYLEARPADRDGWLRLVALRRELGDEFGALQAQLELASQGTTPFADVSNAANRLNSFLRDGSVAVDSAERRAMVEKTRDIMVRRIADANATDCSRLAWLCVNLGDVAAAHAYVNRGLALDPENHHCRGLADKLD